MSHSGKNLPVLNKNKLPHWYKIYLGECPVCGADKGYRERVYGEKPLNPHEVYKHLSSTECYDYCDY